MGISRLLAFLGVDCAFTGPFPSWKPEGHSQPPLKQLPRLPLLTPISPS